MNFKFNKNNSFYFVLSVLFISLIMNIYLSVMNGRYKHAIGKVNYNNLVEVKNRNENTLNVINQCLKSKTINSQELINLYENYSAITDAYNELWLSYNDYGKDELVRISFLKQKESNVEPNLVYSRIENLIFEYMNNKLDNDLEYIELSGHTLENFTNMRDLSLEINNYFINQNDIYFSGLTEEEKELKIIKKLYWIYYLEDITKIMNSYVNEEFTIEK